MPYSKHDYPGSSASKTYDARFDPSHRVPHLKTHVPQGLATWPKWNGQSDLLLLTAYSPRGKRAYIIGLDANSGKRVGSARVKASSVACIKRVMSGSSGCVRNTHDAALRVDIE